MNFSTPLFCGHEFLMGRNSSVSEIAIGALAVEGLFVYFCRSRFDDTDSE